MEKRRVVITGMGAITPLGNSVEETWAGIKAGKSGIGPITLFFQEKTFLLRLICYESGTRSETN